MCINKRNAVALIILIALLALPSLAASTEGKTLPASKVGTLTFSTPTRFGQRDLPAGTYEFHCVHRGAYHLMTIRQIHRSTPGGAEAIGKRVATAYCRMEVLPDKVRMSSARTTKDASGRNVLDEVRIRGEFVRHIFDQALLLDPVQIKSTVHLLQLLIPRGGRP